MNDYFIAPPDAGAHTPAIVLMMHLEGVDESMRDAAQQFSAAGFIVSVPDLYSAFDAPAPDSGAGIPAYLPFAKQLTPASIDADMERGIARIHADAPDAPLAIAGFCMGGRMAMVRSTGYGNRFKAAATWYGFAPDIEPTAVDIPVIGSFGSADAHIPAAEVESWFSRVRVAHDLRIYEGAQHGFFHRAPAYDAAAAADSFDRTVAFLKMHLAAATR
jgi:carboxymethylenebutenolidase